MIDYDKDTITMTQYTKDEHFSLLKDAPTKDGEHEYRLSELSSLADRLMSFLSIPYATIVGEQRKFDSFSLDELKMLYPMALTLACLDGNAFTRIEDKPESDLVWQYIPEAFKLLRSNSVSMEEVGFFVKRAGEAAHGRQNPDVDLDGLRPSD